MDLFEKLIRSAQDPILALSRQIHGGAAFPKLTGDIGSRMTYNGRQHLIWNLNDYLGLANHPRIRSADAETAARWGLGAPMGSRMMSGETDELEMLESELADYTRKPAALFLNYGYQGMVSLIDGLVDRHDWIVYDAGAHACVIDGVRLRQGRAKAFRHNDIGHLETTLKAIQKRRAADEGILVISEGVFGMSGEQGRIADITRLKDEHQFRLLVDDAHGFGVLGPDGVGTGEAQGVQDSIDLYFATFAKAGASIGAFVASTEDIIWRLRYTLRSQIFAKSLPWPIVAGNRVRLAVMRDQPELRKQAWTVAHALRSQLSEHSLDIGDSESLITPVVLAMDPAHGVEFVRLLRDEYAVLCAVVTYPVVKAGRVQLRLIATAAHDVADIPPTVDGITKVHEKMSR